MTVHFEMTSDTVNKSITVTPTHAIVNGSPLTLSKDTRERMVNGLRNLHDLIQSGDLNELSNVKSILRELN